MRIIKPVFAQETVNLGNIRGLGPLGEFEVSIGSALDLFSQVLSNIIGFLTIIGGIWFIFQFLIGALGWLTAGGDKVKVEQAQKRITQGIIGLGVIVIAVFLIDLIGSLIGLDILSPADLILSFWG